TMRASTVIRSIPTRETRTQASITMPLSSTRSSTSIRLVVPDDLSTGIACSWPPWAYSSLPATGAGKLGDLALELTDLLPQLFSFGRLRCPRRQVTVVPPPIQTDLLRLVERAHDQADADGEQLHLRQRHLDIACHDEPF